MNTKNPVYLFKIFWNFLQVCTLRFSNNNIPRHNYYKWSNTMIDPIAAKHSVL